MTPLGTKVIETKRLILRPFTINDALPMYRNWASDDDVTKYMTWPTHEDLSITVRVLSDWLAHYENLSYYQWAIALKENPDEPIGSMGCNNPIDEKIQMAEIGYCISRAYWHQGYTSEALQGVINFLFDEVGVNRIEARHDPKNPNSGKVMQKCGMQYEGTLRQSSWNNQGICDTCYYALLACER